MKSDLSIFSFVACPFDVLSKEAIFTKIDTCKELLLLIKTFFKIPKKFRVSETGIPNKQVDKQFRTILTEGQQVTWEIFISIGHMTLCPFPLSRH